MLEKNPTSNQSDDTPPRIDEEGNTSNHPVRKESSVDYSHELDNKPPFENEEIIDVTRHHPHGERQDEGRMCVT